MPPASTGQKIGFATALLVATVLLSRVLGFLRDAVIAALFGATGATDAFYAAGTIPGGAFFGRRYGIASLAWGTLAGAMIGPFGIMFVAAWRAGMRYRPSLALRHPEFREWLLASIPLMLGVSLVMADDWFIRYFAAGNVGAI